MPALALAQDGAMEGEGPRWGDGRVRRWRGDGGGRRALALALDEEMAGGGARNFLAKVFRVWRESVTFAG